MFSRENLELIWSEDFSYENLEEFESKWNFDIGDGSNYGLIGWGNNELEYYTKESVELKNGITISAEKLNESTDLMTYYGKALWRSGKIHTANKVSFKYGYLEVKAKTPTGIGTWPAIWLLGQNLLQGETWPNCGEIDILETTGANPHQIQGTIHGPGYFGEAGLTKIIQSEYPLAEDLHTYAINWQEDKIEWYFDGNLYNTIERTKIGLSIDKWPFNQEFYLILNLAIGGWFAGEVDQKLEKAQFNIQNISFYSVDGLGELFIK